MIALRDAWFELVTLLGIVALLSALLVTGCQHPVPVGCHTDTECMIMHGGDGGPGGAQ